MDEKPTFEQASARLEALSQTLYERTLTDWAMELHWCVTEPVCPFVMFKPDHGKYRNGGWGDTVPEAMMKAMDILEADLPVWIEQHRVEETRERIRKRNGV